jgi:hypothetical protein
VNAHKWKRRDLLRHAALSALAAPAATFWTDVVEAQPKKTYLVLIFWPNGKVGGNVYTTRTAGGWEFGPAFSAYNEFKSDAIAFEEYTTEDFLAKHYVGGNLGHHAVSLCMFSGEYPTPFTLDQRSNPSHFRGRAPTIDQIVAWDYAQRKIAPSPLRASLSARMPRVLETLSKGIFFQTPADYALGKTYATGLEPTNDLDRPLAGFTKMFGDLAAGGAGGTFDRLWKHGRSMLDAPYAELHAVRSTLPTEGRDLLETHLQKLRELEQSFVAVSADPGAKAPAPPAALDPRAENWDAIFSQWAALIDAAFRADRTRVVSFHFGMVAARVRIPSARLPVSGDAASTGDDHHSYTHVQRNVEIFVKFYADKVAELLRRLKGSGPSPNLLKDSVVMVGTEAGNLHQGTNVPVALFGQAGGYLKTGQLLRFGRGTANYWKHTGTLLAVCRAMGVRIDAVGNPGAEYQRGPWPELLQDG